MKLVDIGVSKSPAGNSVRVQVPPAAPIEENRAEALAYIVGVALGDGNLSSPNGRVTRLRISCDNNYPLIAEEMVSALRILFPRNRVSLVKRTGQGCFDISVYSQLLNTWMPWSVGKGPKLVQEAHVPAWIFTKDIYMKECLRGLIQTDGCIYIDRGYPMVNFVNSTRRLAEDARDMLITIGFRPRFNVLPLKVHAPRYTVKIARRAEAERLIDTLRLRKA